MKKRLQILTLAGFVLVGLGFISHKVFADTLSMSPTNFTYTNPDDCINLWHCLTPATLEYFTCSNNAHEMIAYPLSAVPGDMDTGKPSCDNVENENNSNYFFVSDSQNNPLLGLYDLIEIGKTDPQEHFCANSTYQECVDSGAVIFGHLTYTILGGSSPVGNFAAQIGGAGGTAVQNIGESVYGGLTHHSTNIIELFACLTALGILMYSVKRYIGGGISKKKIEYRKRSNKFGRGVGFTPSEIEKHNKDFGLY